MTRLASNLFERPKLLLSNPTYPYTALIKPEELSPKDRRTLAEKWGLARDDSFTSKLFRTIENPLILIGLVMAARYPIASLKNLFQRGAKLSGLARRPGALRRYIGGIDENFVGIKAGRTDLPEAFKNLTREVDDFKTKWTKIISDSLQKYEVRVGRSITPEEDVLLALKMDGAHVGKKAILKPINMGKDFDDLYKDVRGHYDAMYKEVPGFLEESATRSALKQVGMSAATFKKIQASGSMTKEAQQVVRHRNEAMGVLKEQLRNSGVDVRNFGRKREHYFAHRVPRTREEFERGSRALTEDAILTPAYRQDPTLGAGSTVHGRERLGRMIRSPEDLELVKPWIKEGEVTRLKRILEDVPATKVYSLRFGRTTESYISSLGRAYGWSVKGHGIDLVDGLRRLEQSSLPHNKVRASMLRNSYIPVALGRQSAKAFEASALWEDTKLRMVENLAKGGMSKYVPKDLNKWLTQKLSDDNGILTLRNVQGQLASHMTVGALGLNAVSTTWNTMQTLLTTMPVIGVKHTMQGISRVTKKLTVYAQARSKGMGHEAAIAKVFPDFHSAHLTGAPFVEETLSHLNRSWNIQATTVKSKLEKVKDFMMIPFQSAETFVRLVAFEGTMAKAAAEGMVSATAIPLARRVVETTQFLTGPANLPYMFLERGALLKQFGTFPFRYMNFLTGPAIELGAGAQAGFMGRNWGTLGRAVAGSTLTYEASQEFLGRDISRGLMFGALPSTPEGSLLYPLPFVPPAVSLGAAAAVGLTTGDWEKLIRQAPIMVPGGVAAARMSVALAPGMAEKLGRMSAGPRTPDGRITLYGPDGTLRGYLTPMQMYSMALGIPPGRPESVQREQELAKYILAQRDKLVGMKRTLVDALLTNDSRSAIRVRDQYRKEYPELGDLKVTPQDYRAAQLRMMIPRLERVLESLPSQARPQFAELIRVTMTQEMQSLLGVDPAMLRRNPTIRSRQMFRDPPPQSVREQLLRLRSQRKQVLVPRGDSPF